MHSIVIPIKDTYSAEEYLLQAQQATLMLNDCVCRYHEDPSKQEDKAAWHLCCVIARCLARHRVTKIFASGEHSRWYDDSAYTKLRVNASEVATAQEKQEQAEDIAKALFIAKPKGPRETCDELDSEFDYEKEERDLEEKGEQLFND
jgi:hypothetical protein